MDAVSTWRVMLCLALEGSLLTEGRVGVVREGFGAGRWLRCSSFLRFDDPISSEVLGDTRQRLCSCQCCFFKRLKRNTGKINLVK